MPSPFEFSPISTNIVTLGEDRRAHVSFTVKNVSGRRLNAITRVELNGPHTGSDEWVQVIPDESDTPQGFRRFELSDTQIFTVAIQPSGDVPPGHYNFRLIVADEFKPEDNFTTGPGIQFTVEPQEQTPPVSQPGPRWPLMIGIGTVAVLALLAILLIVLPLFSGDGNSKPHASFLQDFELHLSPSLRADEGILIEAGDELLITYYFDPFASINGLVRRWYRVENEEGQIAGWVPEWTTEDIDDVVEIVGDLDDVLNITPTPAPTASSAAFEDEADIKDEAEAELEETVATEVP